VGAQVLRVGTLPLVRMRPLAFQILHRKLIGLRREFGRHHLGVKYASRLRLGSLGMSTEILREVLLDDDVLILLLDVEQLAGVCWQILAVGVDGEFFGIICSFLLLVFWDDVNIHIVQSGLVVQ